MERTVFFEEVVKELNKRGFATETKVIEKNGVDRFGVMVGDSNCKPTVYLDDLFNEGKSVSESADIIISQVESAEENKPGIDGIVSLIEDTNEVLKRIRVFVSKKGTYKDYIRREENGITLTIAILLGEIPNNTYGSIRVKREMLDKWNIEEEDLWKVAKANSENFVEIKGMSETMVEMMGREQAEMLGMVIPKEEEQMLVVSSPNKVNGAYAAFTEKAREYVKNTFRTDKYFVLPSSIHECIIIPYSADVVDKGKTDEENLKTLAQMVREVNATQVAEEEQLADTPLLMAI